MCIDLKYTTQWNFTHTKFNSYGPDQETEHFQNVEPPMSLSDSIMPHKGNQYKDYTCI